MVAEKILIFRITSLCQCRAADLDWPAVSKQSFCWDSNCWVQPLQMPVHMNLEMISSIVTWPDCSLGHGSAAGQGGDAVPKESLFNRVWSTSSVTAREPDGHRSNDIACTTLCLYWTNSTTESEIKGLTSCGGALTNMKSLNTVTETTAARLSLRSTQQQTTGERAHLRKIWPTGDERVRWLKLWGKFTLRLNGTSLWRSCLGLCRTVQQLYDQRDQQLYGRQFDWQACWKYYEFIGLRFHDRKFIWYVSWPVNSDINSCMKNIVKWFMKSGVAKVSDVFSPAVPAGNLKPWWFTGKLRLHTTTTETQVNSYHKYFGLLFPNPEYPTSANSLSRLPFCLGREILGAIQVS